MKTSKLLSAMIATTLLATPFLAHASTFAVTVQSIFATAASDPGAANSQLRKSLCHWQETSDEEVLQAKTALIVALENSNIRAFSTRRGQYKPQDIAVQTGRCLQDGRPNYIGIYTKRAEGGFAVSLKATSSGQTIRITNLPGSSLTKALYERAQFLLKNGTPELEVGTYMTKYLNHYVLPFDLPVQHVTFETSPNQAPSISVNVSSMARPGEVYSWTVDQNGDLSFHNELVLDQPSPGSNNANDAAKAGVEPADGKFFNAEDYYDLLRAQPRSLRGERMIALYKALAAIASDKRCSIRKIVVEETMRAKGVPSQDATSEAAGLIFMEYGITDFSVGTVTLISKNNQNTVLEFAGGHFNNGTDLNKPSAWLYGRGEVGNQKGLYAQLRAASNSACRF